MVLISKTNRQNLQTHPCLFWQRWACCSSWLLILSGIPVRPAPEAIKTEQNKKPDIFGLCFVAVISYDVLRLVTSKAHLT